jgi:hypothetical protein
MIFLFHHHSTCPAWEPLIFYRKICVTTITCISNMFLPSITAVLAARAQVTVRHGGHDEPYPTTSSLLTSTGSTYPSNSTTAGQSKVTSQLPLPCNATATSILPLPSSYGSRNPYTNATFPGGRHESAPHTSPTQEFAPVTTAPWNELWSLHWPSSDLPNSSSTPKTSLLNVTPILAIPTKTACPDQSSQSPYITMSTAFSTNTLRATSSPKQGMNHAPVQPIIYNPVLLPTPDTLTSTIHITVTASVPSPSPTESPLRESTITSTIVSTLTKTVKPTTAQPSSTLLASSASSAPSSLGLEKSSAMPPMAPPVRTSVMSPDPRCPYPLPGVYCGDPKTTIVTQTRDREASITSSPVAPEGNKGAAGAGWCPYPGGQC